MSDEESNLIYVGWEHDEQGNRVFTLVSTEGALTLTLADAVRVMEHLRSAPGGR